MKLSAGAITPISADIPEAVSFDGTTDYLSRSSDFTGNADGKTFTFSAWVYPVGNSNLYVFSGNNGEQSGCWVSENSGGYRLNFAWYDSSWTFPSGYWQLLMNSSDIPKNTWSHILLSVNKTIASYLLYINDTQNTNFTLPYTNTNDFDFTISQFNIAASNNGSLNKGRLAHIYLDYTYRDLSIEANRRLFITEDLKPADPAGLIALNPIAYFQLKDADTAHVNSGTGGDMFQNGTLDTASRGPNQWNCAASEFDGSADYLSKASLSGAVDSKTITFSFSFRFIDTSRTNFILNGTKIVAEFSGTAFTLTLKFFDSTGNYAARVLVPNVYKFVNHNVNVSFDTSSLGYRICIKDGLPQDDSVWVTYNIDYLTALASQPWELGKYTTSYYNIVLGELYLGNTFIDLSTDNPFWDSDNNLPKPVRQVLEETGNTPLIAMPISADNPGLNLGTGGDFTVNSGPYSGARGGSEFWARSAVVDGSNYLTGNVACASLVSWLSIDGGATWTPTYNNSVTVTNIGNGTNNGVVAFYWGTSEVINWALEENKNRVTDQLGYPKDIYKLVEDNPNTVLAMPFDDMDIPGLNLVGTNFTETGTVVQGPDVTA